MSMIIFYKMTGCGYCVKAEKMLSSYIDSEVVRVLPHTDAPLGMEGFPHFVAPSTGKTHTGCPSSAAELFRVLELQEPFRFRRAREGFSRRVIERMNHKDDSIHFFSMEGCGWCNKAKEMLKPLINSGKVIVKSAEAAPEDADGFPHFVSQLTGESMSGLAAKNVSDFLQKLGHSHSENFLMGGIGSAVRPMGGAYDLPDPRTLEGYFPFGSCDHLR